MVLVGNYDSHPLYFALWAEQLYDFRARLRHFTTASQPIGFRLDHVSQGQSYGGEKRDSAAFVVDLAFLCVCFFCFFLLLSLLLLLFFSVLFSCFCCCCCCCYPRRG